MSTQLFIKIIIFQTRESARSKGPSLVDASVETDETGGLDDLKIIDSGCGSSVGSCDESNKNLLELYQDFRVSFKFKNGPNKAIFYFCSIQTQILQKKTVGFSGIRAWIVGVEGRAR